MEELLKSWLFGDIYCICREDRLFILDICLGGLDEERDLLLPLIVGNVDEWILFVVDDLEIKDVVRLDALLLFFILKLCFIGTFSIVFFKVYLFKSFF